MCWVLHSSVANCLTHTPRSWVGAALDPVGFHGSVFGQDTSEPQPSTSETQKRHEQGFLLGHALHHTSIKISSETVSCANVAHWNLRWPITIIELHRYRF